jgi:hypothetical protein
VFSFGDSQTEEAAIVFVLWWLEQASESEWGNEAGWVIARVRLHFHPVMNIPVLNMYASKIDRHRDDYNMPIQSNMVYRVIKIAIEMAHTNACGPAMCSTDSGLNMV